MTVMILEIISLLILIFTVYYLNKYKKEEEEKYFILKIIGYLILNGYVIFRFSINRFFIMLPLGTFINYLFIFPSENKSAKQTATNIGLVLFALNFISAIVN